MTTTISAIQQLGQIGLPMPIQAMASQTWDAIVVGAGHNGLTCATYLARAGKKVRKQEDDVIAKLDKMIEELEQQQKHVRSAEVEQVLGMARDAFGTAAATHGVLANADLIIEPAVGSDGQTHDVTQGTIGGLTTHADRELRRTAWENYADAHLNYKNTMANALAAGVKQDVFNMRVRGYQNSLEAALSSNFIPTEVFHNLINTY